jgi:hypothetical protein
MSEANSRNGSAEEAVGSARNQDDAPRTPRARTSGQRSPAYFPTHHAPQPPPQPGVHPLDGTSLEVCRDRLACEQADGHLEVTHGEIRAAAAEQPARLQQRAPEDKAAGIKAVVSSLHFAWGKAGLIRGTLPLLQLNQKDGVDCMSCAWPDPDGKRSPFDFCENGAAQWRTSWIVGG